MTDERQREVTGMAIWLKRVYLDNSPWLESLALSPRWKLLVSLNLASLSFCAFTSLLFFSSSVRQSWTPTLKRQQNFSFLGSAVVWWWYLYVLCFNHFSSYDLRFNIRSRYSSVESSAHSSMKLLIGVVKIVLERLFHQIDFEGGTDTACTQQVITDLFSLLQLEHFPELFILYFTVLTWLICSWWAFGERSY